MDESATTPELQLLKKIEDELTVISEEQHARARQAAILKKARTLLHVGCSTIEVTAMLAEHLRKGVRASDPRGAAIAR